MKACLHQVTAGGVCKNRLTDSTIQNLQTCLDLLNKHGSIDRELLLQSLTTESHSPSAASINQQITRFNGLLKANYYDFLAVMDTDIHPTNGAIPEITCTGVGKSSRYQVFLSEQKGPSCEENEGSTEINITQPIPAPLHPLGQDQWPWFYRLIQIRLSIFKKRQYLAFGLIGFVFFIWIGLITGLVLGLFTPGFVVISAVAGVIGTRGAYRVLTLITKKSLLIEPLFRRNPVLLRLDWLAGEQKARVFKAFEVKLTCPICSAHLSKPYTETMLVRRARVNGERRIVLNCCNNADHTFRLDPMNEFLMFL
ncbi:hypothetical protein [Reinekea sp. G2M2-21]|uniref:hypothetical protein n=1 Tax=Reinekea sp. G2M2-21 TaxID=2788942 RepID=UPI0018A8DBEE|nr:hypothetical protein [Reinekea sp. G2M2-21]